MMCVLCLQSLQERTQAEQFLRVFGLSTEYVSHCKVCNENFGSAMQTSSLLHQSGASGFFNTCPCYGRNASGSPH